jgi:NitT/TauT family transport system ATP-binding protein
LQELEVPIPRPRRWDALVENDEFKRLSGQVLNLVRSA